ncbi:hypothetical protein JCM19376_07200 [Fusibacter bizertensis]
MAPAGPAPIINKSYILPPLIQKRFDIDMDLTFRDIISPSSFPVESRITHKISNINKNISNID